VPEDDARLSFRRHIRGFTLLEIMTVIVIMGVMIAITMPSMKAMNEKNKLRSTARELIALMKYARSEAVFGHRMTEVFLDLDKRLYWMDLRTPDAKTGEYNPKAKKTQLEQKRELNNKISFDEVSVYDSNIVKGKLIAVDFYPDGSASPMLITLANLNGSKMTIEIIKSTGLTEVTPGTIEEKKALAAQDRATNPVYQNAQGNGS
jgi:type II secretion system protein H